MLTFGVDDLRFTTTYWYGDVDLPKLEERFGHEFLEKVYFHISAFEANKLCSLRPRSFDLGPFTRFHTPRFEATWRTVQKKVWAQWRYEHDDPDYAGPELVSDPVGTEGGALEAPAGETQALSFCGGGKDSLVAMKLLERCEVSFDAFSYSSSIYGRAEPQHELIDQLLDCSAARHRRRLWIYDDFMDSPVARLHPELGVRYVLAGETPSSVFGAVPLALEHGYRQLVLAHERSADFGNLTWDQTGEEINHQWGKSLEAERLLADYLRRELVSNVDYFSLLKPIYDVLIFQLLARDVDSVRYAHSCNESKPWCRRCAKCVYVWLNYMAYLPTEEIDAIFGENLFDVPANMLFFRQMLGLEEHTPFECIGTVDEVRLAFELCRRKGLTGQAMDLFRRDVGAFEVEPVLDRFLAVDAGNSAIPPELFGRIREDFVKTADEARRRLSGEVGSESAA